MPAPAAAADPSLYSVALDSFPGATDDAKLDSALSYVATQTYKPTIQLGTRQTTFGKTRLLFDGFSISGPAGVGTEFSFTNKVKISTPGTGWLDVPAPKVRGIYIGGLCFEGDSNTTFFVDHDNNGPVLWASTIRDVGFNLFRHVIWGAHDAVTFDGFWDVNNCYDTEFKLWGSDSNYFTNGLLIDSPNTGTGNRYHVWAPWLGKTTFGPMFITGKANTTPMRIDGGRGIVVQAARFEAQQGNPTLGSQLLITGGTFVRIRDPWFFNGMSAAGSTGHSTPAYDKGIVTITGGSNIVIDGAMFSDGDGNQTGATAAGTPHVYVGGGTGVRLRNLQASTSDQLRVVRAATVNASAIVTDPDVTVTVG
ncbi:hypothetical protein GCM10009765_56530 [Fodinicola feengrottensis]|uniref:Uncharacterized protein n=1 Tax=Fodinicola feengrottensis TaxID=435914 RepID=A0ABP4U6T1_9ACTN